MFTQPAMKHSDRLPGAARQSWLAGLQGRNAWETGEAPRRLIFLWDNRLRRSYLVASSAAAPKAA